MEKDQETQTVLIVDDRRENIVFLANSILKPKGYDIITAMDGEKGLQKALEEKPDLIIMDLRMPKMDGLEVLTALHEKRCHIPVILTTIHGSESVAIEAFRLGIKDYIVKPYTVEDMEAAIERALGEGRAEKRVWLGEEISEIHQQLERRIRELGTLHDIGRVVTSLLDLEKIANRVVEAAVFLTGADEGFLLLVNQETQELYVRAALGLRQREARSSRVKVDDSLSGHVVTTGKPIMVNSVQDPKKFQLKTGDLVKALLHVPLKLKNEVIGVLSVHNRVSPKAFTGNDLHALTILAGYAAVAIENARLYQGLEEKVQQLSQILSDQKGAIREDTDETIQFMREIEIHEQRLGKSREGAEQLAAAAKDLAERLKVQEKEAKKLAERWRTSSEAQYSSDQGW